MNLYILPYNNYYNRIVKKFETIEEYVNDAALRNVSVVTIATTNFNPNDGINTQHILNMSVTSDGILKADYVIAVDSQSNIISRWFIIEAQMQRGYQYLLTLRRDLMADYYDDVVSATCFIEKAWIRNTDIARYNSEDIAFNQIKKAENTLTDKIGIPWIVGYYNDINEDKTVNVASLKFDTIGSYATEEDFYSDIGYNATDGWKHATSVEVVQKLYLEPSFAINALGVSYIFGNNTAVQTLVTSDTCLGLSNVPTGSNRLPYVKGVTQVLHNNQGQIFDVLFSDTLPSDIHAGDIIEYQEKYVNISNKIYKISISDGEDTHVDYTMSAKGSNLYITIKNILLDEFSNAFENSELNSGTTYAYDYRINRITLTQVTFASETLTIRANAPSLQDAPYKMFMIPAGDITYHIGVNSNSLSIEKKNAINIGNYIFKTLTKEVCLDVQLLPYCPLINQLGAVSAHNIYLDDLTEDVDYDYVVDGSNNVTNLIFFPRQSSFTFDIDKTIEESDDILEKKIQIQCDKYRIVSPNYAAMFDFNIVKTGTINKFNVDCTYRPHTPYIHINPVWSNLYGEDYNDARGLICQGDFSITLETDAWNEYQIANKNYLNAFNRQVEHIEFENKYQKINDVVNAVSGVGQGAAAGAVAGSAAGPYGAAAGAIVGGVSSAVGGIADVTINEKLRNEALDLTKDQFNFSMDNIKALPNTIAKISTINENNKIFPILEYYTCTNEEKEIFRDKLRYNGMTVMRIGHIEDFIEIEPHYVKAKLIRLTTIADDYHLINAISGELNKGVYI